MLNSFKELCEWFFYIIIYVAFQSILKKWFLVLLYIRSSVCFLQSFKLLLKIKHFYLKHTHHRFVFLTLFNQFIHVWSQSLPTTDNYFLVTSPIENFVFKIKTWIMLTLTIWCTFNAKCSINYNNPFHFQIFTEKK